MSSVKPNGPDTTPAPMLAKVLPPDSGPALDGLALDELARLTAVKVHFIEEQQHQNTELLEGLHTLAKGIGDQQLANHQAIVGLQEVVESLQAQAAAGNDIQQQMLAVLTRIDAKLTQQ